MESNRNDKDQKVNEGFSGENISNDYNPADEKIEDRLKTETETDQFGNEKTVERARFPKADAETSSSEKDAKAEKSVENRDHNYDKKPNRNPDSNRENQGNLDLDN